MLQTYLSIYSPKSHLQASASKRQTRNYILLIQMSSVYKTNAKYLRIRCYGRRLGILGGGIKGKEENTKFDSNSETTTGTLPKNIYFFYKTDDNWPA